MEKRKCLIITDVQKDFCPGGNLAVENGITIIPIINKITSKKSFYKIIATQDWHPENHNSFASNNIGHNAFDIVKEKDGVDVLWPDHCIKGTEGAKFHDDLIINDVDLIIRKGIHVDIDSYSTFMENDKSTITGLSGYLHEHSITEVYLCGIATDVCVYYSAMDSIKFGFKTFVIDDAVAGVDLPAGNIQRTCKVMADNGITFINSDDLE